MTELKNLTVSRGSKDGSKPTDFILKKKIRCPVEKSISWYWNYYHISFKMDFILKNERLFVCFK